MAKNKYYYYDQKSCSFKEVEPKRSKRYWQAGGTLLLALGMAVLLAWGMDARWISTPEEAALAAKNEALREQVADASERVQRFSRQLDTLEKTDRELYRKLLQAEPISEDVRRVGIGGTEPHKEIERFEGKTGRLMRKTEEELDRLERQVRLQKSSYARLTRMAEERRSKLAHLPAMLPANGRVVSGFGLRDHPVLEGKKMHAGIDILIDKGAPIIAPGKGVVSRVDFSASYGKVVEIEHEKTGYTTRYAHLSRIADRIEKGYEVDRGETFAYGGDTGRSTGPHLHYEVRKTETDRAVNPVYFFAPSMTPEQYRKMLRKSKEPGAAFDY
ncbi:MAG: M23 family peptidase [Bacteroidetes bacterium QS_9_68_14]|nr:MAG: M23 family peptidase [Bacteroidetes bacterium QS_9_68_14]